MALISRQPKVFCRLPHINLASDARCSALSIAVLTYGIALGGRKFQIINCKGWFLRDPEAPTQADRIPILTKRVALICRKFEIVSGFDSIDCDTRTEKTIRP
jgi:hypothetical protein